MEALREALAGAGGEVTSAMAAAEALADEKEAALRRGDELEQARGREGKAGR
jgi:hypothetical protein